MMHERLHEQDAVRLLSLLACDDGLLGIRALHPAQEKHFAADCLDAALHLLQRLDGQRPLYAVLNPIRPDSVNPSAKDEDILCLRWFPLDADPERPSDTASTDEEKADAFVVMSDTLRFLTRHLPGVERSLLRADSGNGAHALLRLPDYPVSEASRLKRIGDALCHGFSSDSVKMDRSIYNPARIWRFYGTKNIKGNNTQDRPHRRAAILPDQPDPVPFDLLAHWDTLAAALRIGVEAKAKSPVRGNVTGENRAAGETGEVPRLPSWWTEPVKAGDRNSTAYQRARWLLNAHEGCRNEKQAWSELAAWNMTCCRPPLGKDELRRCFESARNGGDNAEFSCPAPDAWETPTPFMAHALPSFPLEALPSTLAGFVAEVAASTQVPVDMPAMLALAVVGAAGAGSCRVQVGQTHTEPLNTYVAVVMEPGSRKSATMEAMSAPLRDAERQRRQDTDANIAGARERRAVEDKRLTFLRDKAAKESNDIERGVLQEEIADLAAALTDVPAVPRLLADDVTPEKLAGLLAEQSGVLALLSAEGGVFGMMAGRYQNAGVNLDLYLKGHAGESYRVDRVGRPPDDIASVRLTLGLAVQPDVLHSLADSPTFRGRGLLGRFLFSLPENLVGGRAYQNRPVCPKAQASYNAAIRAVLAFSPPDADTLHSLRLDGPALEIWTEYHDETERRQADGGDLAGIRDWASKLAGAVARIAGGLHLIENAGRGCPWDNPIGPITVAAAWAIGEYLTPHALAAFGQMGADQNLVHARRLLAWIKRTRQTEFSLRDAHRAHQNVTGFSTAQDLMPALSVLCDRGFVREASATPTGGRPKSVLYDVNPAVNHGEK